ncbi:hypothetical protein FLONG3_6871 [Fusarium longipes]|uniref:Uncharacterized protein n=1 Tax=Fusarium longipes TaxID=694270 RepID=A0A395SIB5_9HYPO|nr:hypothetical protein FLONG3_6871 [Fusarium longipes]
MASATRIVFATDLETNVDGLKWEPWSAIEIGFDRTTGLSKLQVVYRTYEGVADDISANVSCANPPSDDGQTFDLSRPWSAEDPVKLGFEVSISSLDPKSATLKGSATTVEGTSLSWRGKAIGLSCVALDIVQAGPQPIDADVQTLLDIMPFVVDNDKHRDDITQKTSNEVFTTLMRHATPVYTRERMYKDLEPIEGVVKSPPIEAASHDLPDIYQPRSILDANHRFLELSSMHMLCHGWKMADWLGNDLTKDIHDRQDDFFTLVKCPENELEAAKQKYGSNLPAAQEAETLRNMYRDCIPRCYELGYWVAAHSQWSRLKAAGGLDVLDKAKKTLESDAYKLHWVPRLINNGTTNDSIPISERIALLADKLRMLQRICGTNDQNMVKSIVDGLRRAAELSGIARESLIGTPDKAGIPYSFITQTFILT